MYQIEVAPPDQYLPLFFLVLVFGGIGISFLILATIIIFRRTSHGVFVAANPATISRVPDASVRKDEVEVLALNTSDIEWINNGYYSRIRHYLAIDIVVLGFLFGVMVPFYFALERIQFLWTMLLLVCILGIPLMFLIVHIEFYALTPYRIGFHGKGALLEYTRELRVYRPLKSVNWNDVEKTHFYEPLKISVFTFVFEDDLTQVHVDKFLQGRLQKEFEAVKGVDKDRDVNKEFSA